VIDRAVVKVDEVRFGRRETMRSSNSKQGGRFSDSPQRLVGRGGTLRPAGQGAETSSALTAPASKWKRGDRRSPATGRLKWGGNAAIFWTTNSFGSASGAGMIRRILRRARHTLSSGLPGAETRRDFRLLQPASFQITSKVTALLMGRRRNGNDPVGLKGRSRQAHGKSAAKNKVIGNLFFFESGAENSSVRIERVYVGGLSAVAGSSRAAAVDEVQAILDRWYKKYPPLARVLKAVGPRRNGFQIYNYYINVLVARGRL